MYNKQNKLAKWTQLISQCRGSGLTVSQWCEENGISQTSYYKWQRKVYELAQAQQESHFVEVTPVQPVPNDSGDVAVTVRIAGAEADIHPGADAATVEMVLRVLKSC